MVYIWRFGELLGIYFGVYMGSYLLKASDSEFAAWRAAASGLGQPLAVWLRAAANGFLTGWVSGDGVTASDEDRREVARPRPVRESVSCLADVSRGARCKVCGLVH